ncbi:MAG: peptidase, partial [Acidobacteriota bacterium]
GQVEAIDLVQYLSHFKRELPGDDMEFGFPRGPDDIEARPENRGISRWWQECAQPFQLHVSLHGIAFAAGPWFLIEPSWASHCQELKTTCRRAVEEMGYRLHDVDRQGEKGFRRLEEGFCTRPDSQAMAQYFRDLQDESTARLFRPSSMEAIRALGGDPLTLVTEMPLFILPNVGETLGPPDPEALRWKERIERWKAGIDQEPQVAESIGREAVEYGLRAMPIRDQMQLQWTFIAAGVGQVPLRTCPEN